MSESYKVISSSILFWFSQKKWFVYSVLISIFLLNLSTPVGLTVPAYHSLIILLLVFMLVTFEPIPFPAIALLPNGKNAHINIQPPKWWHEKFLNFQDKLKNIKVICICTLVENKKKQYFPLQYNDKLTNYSSK